MKANLSQLADPGRSAAVVPLILAPAGSQPSFMAALAAGAEAVYCGLKSFSARMAAKNFSLDELCGLVDLAHARGVRVYVTLNTLLKPDEIEGVGRLLDQLGRQVRPDAVIVQDLALAPLVRQTGFAGQVIWSTLANMTFPAALPLIRRTLPIDGLVLPRELSIDEIRAMAGACPPDLGLEVFIHGALCYAVSGRCYWSSFLGGKSGLRGRCVQPCRRIYTQAGEGRRLFSCQDLSLDVLVKVLRSIPQIRAWKIEGRKKGPHYVYYVVSAYRLLRDHGGDPQAKKDALHLLSRALGRPGTHYSFLPQRPQNPVDSAAQTGSGLFIGRIQGAARQAFFVPRHALLAGDLVRIGYEDAPGHGIERLGRAVPKGGRYALAAAAERIPRGTPVFLIDRREQALDDMIRGLEADLRAAPPARLRPSRFRPRLPAPAEMAPAAIDLRVYRRPPPSTGPGRIGLWLGSAAVDQTPEAIGRQVWWWLPPATFPDDEEPTRALIRTARGRGGRRFVLNDPWQVALFASDGPAVDLWAGPFCNLANPLALETAAALGFSGAIVSPELAAADFLTLPRRSPLPLGIVVGGSWPLCVARSVADELGPEQPFRSPRGEEAWTVRYGSLYWAFPNWRLELRDEAKRLRRAGYGLFVHLVEPVPQAVRLKDRPGLWNWAGELL
jgi:putative protease